ncbi:hypothetical protein V6767_19130 [Martelella sp. FLE1502]
MQRAASKTVRRTATAVIAVAFIVSTPFVVPNGIESVKLLALRNDPVKLTDYRLEQLTPADYDRAIREALASDDPDLAESVITLADSRGVRIDGAERERVEIAVSEAGSLGNQIYELWDGALTGKPDSAVGLVGAIATDLTTVGDVRDIIIEGGSYLQGEDYDPLILGLSVAGLAITGAVVLSGGSASSAKIGTSTLKAAGKAGAIATPLRRSFTRLSGEVVSGPALRKSLPLLKRGNVPAARRALTSSLDVKPLVKMQDAAMEVGTVMTKNGFKAGTDMLKVADTPADLTKLGKLSTRFGKRFRAIVFMLGSGAITLAGVMLTAASWTATFAMWLAGAAYFGYRALRIGWRFLFYPAGRIIVRLWA